MNIYNYLNSYKTRLCEKNSAIYVCIKCVCMHTHTCIKPNMFQYDKKSIKYLIMFICLRML